MTKKYLNSKDTEKEFYFYLGLLATLFSKMESNLLDILGKLIVDDFVLTNTILEKNSLAQNIELLKSINRYRGFQEKYFESLISKMGSVRKNRNLFIHGVWSELCISC